MKDHKLPFIVLAGSPAKRDELMEFANVDYKAEIDINGKSMLYRVLEAISDSEYYSYILVVGIPKERCEVPENIPDDKIEFYSIEGSQVDKIFNSAIHLRDKGKNNPELFPAGTNHTLFISADACSITGDVFKRFINECGDRSSDFNHSAVEKVVMDTKFPDNGRSFTVIDGVSYCTGDVNLSNIDKVEVILPKLKSITKNRKNFMKALFWASPYTFIKLTLKRVKKKDMERLMTKIFKMDSKLVISKDAELAFDVDKPFQLEIMKKYITKLESNQ